MEEGAKECVSKRTIAIKFGGGSIKIWDCICSKNVGWTFKVNNNLDAILYREILADEMMKSTYHYFDGSNFVFMRDKDPKYNYKVVHNWFASNNINGLSCQAKAQV